MKTKRRGLLKDRSHCAYCGEPLSPDTTTIDHVYPKSALRKLSRDHRDALTVKFWRKNYLTACGACNQKKKDTHPVRWIIHIKDEKRAYEFACHLISMGESMTLVFQHLRDRRNANG